MPVNAQSTQAAASNQGQKANLEWSRYSTQYDEMCDFIPAYQENIDSLLHSIPALDLPEYPRILDLGAGTGNYIVALHAAIPNASFTHVDLDTSMNTAARKKYVDLGIDAVVVENYIQRVQFDASSFDLVICVNALCHAAPQAPVLRKINSWLTPDGTLFLIDFGRPVKLIDWGWYIFKNAVKNFGVLKYLSALVKNRQTFFQNRRAKKDQKQGSMWLHTPEEFQSVLESASFELIQSGQCYRGYCDMAICKPIVNK